MFSRSPVCVPRTKMAVLAPSTSFGSRASSARFERAFLGFLYSQYPLAPSIQSQEKDSSHYIVRSMSTVSIQYSIRRGENSFKVGYHLRLLPDSRMILIRFRDDPDLSLSCLYLASGMCIHLSIRTTPPIMVTIGGAGI